MYCCVKREKTEILLYHVLLRNCLNLNASWYGGFEQIRYEIKELTQCLPHWTDAKIDTFFFIAYLQCLNNEYVFFSIHSND